MHKGKVLKMNNSQFLAILKESFITYLKTGARSNKKLEVLHGAISQDLQTRLNDKKYSVYSFPLCSACWPCLP